MSGGRGPSLDLRDHPFTRPGSRLLVLATADGDGVSLASATYEVPIERCLVLPALRLFVGGELRRVREARPAAVEFEGGETLVFVDDETLSLSLPEGGATLVIERTGGAAGRHLAWRVDDAEIAARSGTDGALVVEVAPNSGATRLLLAMSSTPSRAPAHAQAAAAASRDWDAWFDRRPAVRPDLAATADLAWWVLGANQIRLPGHPGRLIVAPSKLGYVAAWQWDSYFIATGLRHGARDLAWDQIALFLEHQRPDGLLPDVISDEGVIASVADLPPAERARGGFPLATPVTKPPLAAWAAWNVLASDGDPARLAWAASRLEALQRWWSSGGDADGNGLSEYAHPYSSGLDDSPLFDGGWSAGAVESPDLNAYLGVSDDRLARFARAQGDPERARVFEARAETRVRRLVDLRWVAARGRFRAMAGGQPVAAHTPFALMPLLTGRLPGEIAAALAADLTDPASFWTPWPVPTVAADEPAFDPDRMWRGPVWLNVNRLLVEGLAASGFGDLANDLAERTLALVIQGGGMHEHWNPLTGGRPPTATSCFSWSAACFIDLAVAVSTRRLPGSAEAD